MVKSNVFAAADDGVGVGDLPEFIAKLKSVFQLLSETASAAARAVKAPRGFVASCCRQTGDLPFHECRFQSADACDLTNGINSGDGSLLRFINAHMALLDFTPKQHRQFDIRHESKTAGEKVTRLLPRATTAMQRDA